MPKHRAPESPFHEHATERAKDRAGENANSYGVTPALKSLADALLPDDEPNPDDENWGAGEPEPPQQEPEPKPHR